MKKYALLLAFAPVFAWAAPELPFTCSAGEMGNDDYVAVTIGEEAIDFTMHETHITVARENFQHVGETYALLETETKGTVEGDEFTAMSNALLVYNAADNTLVTTLVLDGHPQLAGQILSCAQPTK